MNSTRVRAAWDFCCAACFFWLLIDSWISGNKPLLAVAPLLIAIFLHASYRGVVASRVECRKRLLDKIAAFREAGLYPPPELATDNDVRHLVQIGEKYLAVRLYRETYGVPPKAARKAIKRISS